MFNLQANKLFFSTSIPRGLVGYHPIDSLFGLKYRIVSCNTAIDSAYCSE